LSSRDGTYLTVDPDGCTSAIRRSHAVRQGLLCLPQHLPRRHQHLEVLGPRWPAVVVQFAPLPDLGIDRPKSRRAQLGVGVPQLGQPTPCAIWILRRSGEDGARRHRDASKKHMKYNPALEAELLVEVQRAEVAFLGASHRCGELSTDSVTECMEPDSRNYLNAFRAFSDLVLNGKVPQRSQVGD